MELSLAKSYAPAQGSGRKHTFIRGLNAVGILTITNVLSLASVLIVTVLLGRTSGPESVGVFSLTIAIGAILQSISVAGLSGAALNSLLKPGNDYRHEMRIIFSARVFMIPIIYGVGGLIVHLIPGLVLPPAGIFSLFLIGYALGTLDVADLSHTAKRNFNILAARRLMVTAALAPIKFWFAWNGQLEWTLLAMAVESALWQLILIPGAGLRNDILTNFGVLWGPALKRIWQVRHLWASSLVGSVAQRIDLFVVSAVLGVYSTGQYSTASRPVEATTMIAASLITVLLSSVVKSSESPKKYAIHASRASRITFCSAVCISVIVALIGPHLIVYFYGQEFASAASLVPLYALAIVFIFQERVLDMMILVEEYYILNLIYSTVTIITNVGLNLLLIPQLGIVGATLAAVLTRPISMLVAFCPHSQGRRMLVITFGGIMMTSHRIQSTTNALVRRRRKPSR